MQVTILYHAVKGGVTEKARELWPKFRYKGLINSKHQKISLIDEMKYEKCVKTHKITIALQSYCKLYFWDIFSLSYRKNVWVNVIIYWFTT